MLVRFLACGSVDDGKSTLIGRLLHDTQAIHEDQLAAVTRDSARFGTTGELVDLALVTDGLRAERELGITIDVAYRQFSTTRRTFVIADTPGHEQYTRNMVTGASRCDVAVILVDARHGVQPQTRRHSFIVSLLGIQHAVVTINKMDLVGYAEDVFERIRSEYATFAERLAIPDVRFIPVSALHGDNVVATSAAMPWYQGPTLLAYLETVDVTSDPTLADLRFPVQYVIRPHLDFRGSAGTLASGVLRTGDEVVALPSGAQTRVRSIVAYGENLEEAFAGMAVTVTLADEIDVSRGDMLVHRGHVPEVGTDLEAMLVWMADTPWSPGRSYWIKHTTRTVAGTIAALRHVIDPSTLARRPASRLEMNQVGQVALELTQPVAWDTYADNRVTGRFIVIDRSTNDTVAAGMIVASPGAPRADALTPAARRAEGRVTPAEREARFRQKPVTVLVLGPEAAAPMTIAEALERRLFDAGHTAVVVGHDGDAMQPMDRPTARHDPFEGVRHRAAIARALNDAGLISIVAAVVPEEAEPEHLTGIASPHPTLTVFLSPRPDIPNTVDRIVGALNSPLVR